MESATGGHSIPTTDPNSGTTYQIVTGNQRVRPGSAPPRSWPQWDNIAIGTVDTGGCVWQSYQVRVSFVERHVWGSGGVALARRLRPGLATWWDGLTAAEQSAVQADYGATSTAATACRPAYDASTRCAMRLPYPAMWSWSITVYYEWELDSSKRYAVTVASGTDWLDVLAGDTYSG